jgi:hypothetical protein
MNGAIASALIGLVVAVLGLVIIWLTPPGDSQPHSK